MEIACRWSALVPAYRAVRAALGETAVVMAHMSHVYPEGASIYFSFAGVGDVETYRKTWTAALSAALAAGANTSHHHGIGRWKSVGAAVELGGARRWFDTAKRTFDPAGVLSPGRLFSDEAATDAVAVTPPPDAAPPLEPDDGLGRTTASVGFEARCDAVSPGEPRWPWARLEGPAPWFRPAWRTGAVEVWASIDGREQRIGRGPRSAVGPDVRQAVLADAPDAQALFATAAPGPRWMGEAEVERPWAIARAILRADLRPCALTVVNGRLRVGFRGPASSAFGAIASALVPGGLTPRPWSLVAEPVGPFVEAPDDDPRVVAVIAGTALRPEGS
jgi:hypothetical protein